jgi:hypothetical protein
MQKSIRTRKWLNPGRLGGTAFIATELEPRKGGWCWSEIKIADCNRVVSLDFGFDNDEEFKDRIAKLDLLINDMTEFKAKLVSLREKAK